MDTFSYNNRFLTKNGEPWFPVMGEFHYSRYPCSCWDESLARMKAGGVNIVSTYTIWIHHEEIENEYDFSGNRDLRRFVQCCADAGLYVFLRIGPWVHGEVRNGGFPDWLLKKGFPVRENNEAYFSEVKKFYSVIFDQVRGLLHKDGGPIIGIQIENEYGHCGGLTGEAGEEHMKRLYSIALETGFDVPYFTATGWGGAVTGGLLPVMGGYCDAPWDKRTTKLEPNPNYIFTHERNDHNIGSDHELGHGITFDINRFPFLMAELGGGLQVTYRRRPVATARDIGAMSLVKLGCGVNLLGYYMYHGGTNPMGKLSTLQESTATGYPNDLPELSYDFNAPIREYGQISDTFREIKLLALFLNDFGSSLCEMVAYIPDENPLKPSNLTDLRTSVRHNGNEGYIFINNYQRGYDMAEHKNVTLTVGTDEKAIRFPPIDIRNGDYMFFPFSIKENRAWLATPLCKINGETIYYGNYDVPDLKYLITRQDALNAWKIRLDREYLVISENPVIPSRSGYEILATRDIVIKCFPELPFVPRNFEKLGSEGIFTCYGMKVPVSDPSVAIKKVSDFSYEISFSGLDPTANDYFLDIDYVGNTAKMSVDGCFSADNFYTGQPWEISLRRFDFPEKITIDIVPLRKTDDIYLESWPEFDGEWACELRSAVLKAEWRVPLDG